MARTSSKSNLTPHQAAQQQVVGKINNASASSVSTGVSQGKRKRKEKSPAEAAQVAVNASMDAGRTGSDAKEDADEGKGKKKRRKGGSQNTRKEIASATVAPQQERVSEASPTIESSSAQSKKKRKRKDPKGKQRAVPPPSDMPIDPALTAQGVGNANAFISAVMTAAAASSSSPSAAAMSAAQQVINAQASQAHAQSFGYPHYPVPSGTPGYVGMASAHAHAHGPPSSFPQNALLPGLEGLDATLAGEELARVLQDLDLPKLANALRALGDTGVSSVFPLPGQVGPEQSGSGTNSTIPPLPPDRSHGHGPSLTPTHVGTGDGSGGQVPAPSAVILGQPLHHPPAPPSVGQTASIAIPTWLEQDPDHAHLLANKWLSATKLNELARTKGLVYKKGKFSSTEENTIRESIESYREKNGLMHEQLRELIFAKGAKAKDTTFWFEITSQIPQRPVVAVYHHVRRSYHPMKQQGKWMPAEDDFLRQAVAELGQSWEKVSTRVGRMAGDCRDRWRNHINNREGRVMGVWSKEEEERLTQIVTEMTTAQGKDPDLDIFWTQVAARMGNRGRHQCRIKWTDALSKTVKNEGQKPRWSQQDAFILVHKIASLNVRDDSEIDWKLLADDDWNLWSAHSLQRRWLTLKRSVRGHEDMSHQEIMDILRVKKAHAPPTPGPVRVRVTSAPMVPVEAQAADVDVEMSSIAGPSGFVPVHSSGMGDPLPHFSSVAPADTQGDLRIGTSAIPTVVEVPLIDSSSSSSSSSSSDSDSDSSDSD